MVAPVTVEQMALYMVRANDELVRNPHDGLRELSEFSIGVKAASSCSFVDSGFSMAHSSIGANPLNHRGYFRVCVYYRAGLFLLCFDHFWLQ